MKVFVFFVCLCVLAACKKPRTIKIIAENAVTGSRYAGLSYKVVSSKTTANGEKYQTEAEGVLNQNGEALVDVNVKKGRSYSVRIGALDNICYHNELDQYFDSPYDVEGIFTYKFAECANLKLNINNINCSGISDTMNFRSQYSFMEPDLSWSSNRIGCYNYLSPSYFKVPEGWRVYELRIKRNGFVSFKKDSIFLNNSINSTIYLDY